MSDLARTLPDTLRPTASLAIIVAVGLMVAAAIVAVLDEPMGCADDDADGMCDPQLSERK